MITDWGSGFVTELSLRGSSGFRGLASGFRLAQSFMDDHFQVGLVAQAAFRCLEAGFGDVSGVKADGGGRNGSLLRLCEWDVLSRERATDAAAAQATFLGGFFEFRPALIFILKPPFGFFRLR